MTLVVFSFASRDDADDIAFTAAAVANHEQPQAATQAEQDKAIFVFGVVWVVNELGVLIGKDRLGVFKSHPVLA